MEMTQITQKKVKNNFDSSVYFDPKNNNKSQKSPKLVKIKILSINLSIFFSVSYKQMNFLPGGKNRA